MGQSEWISVRLIEAGSGTGAKVLKRKRAMCQFEWAGVPR